MPLTPIPAVPASPYDVCHASLAWRAVLGVNAALAVALVAASETPGEALASVGPWTLGGVLGTSLWLGALCALQAVVGRLPGLARRLALVALGAGCSLVAFRVVTWLMLSETVPMRWFGAALVGAALAWVMSLWIEQRHQVLRPAHADARLAELQARMRPHFLFNTLNTATALVRVDPIAAETMLEDLSDLFRAALNEAKVTTLGDEIQVAKQYLAIEKLRFGDRMQVTWDLDDAANGAPVPSLMLQPLIENAMHHGVESLQAGAWVRVRTQATKDSASLEVENNVGATTPTGSGMALANVRERLRLLHDLDGRFDARREGDRFIVRVSMPLKMTVTA